MSILIVSCVGSESIDVKSAESSCDCVDLKIEIFKGQISFLEGQDNKEFLETEEWEAWQKKRS